MNNSDFKIRLAPFFRGPAGENGAAGAEGTEISSTGQPQGKVLSTDGADGASWETVAGTGDMLAASNLSDVADATTAVENLGLTLGIEQTFTSLSTWVIDHTLSRIPSVTVTDAAGRHILCTIDNTSPTRVTATHNSAQSGTMRIS